MDLPAELVRTLYSAPPEEFMAVRKQLSSTARDDGDAELAKAVTALRKPTVAASIVNRQAHADPDGVDRLLELGGRLRAAHEELDATSIRDLSGERRALVGELTTAAFALVGQSDPSTTLRDEVSNSFDAAVADPQIAARLGHLTRPERWSGFGVATDVPPGAPELTLVRGGKDRRRGRRASSTKGASASTSPPARGRDGTGSDKTGSDKAASDETGSDETGSGPRVPPAVKRRLKRAQDKARSAFERAEADLRGAEQDEQAADERVRGLVDELSRLQSELDDGKAELERSRRAVKSARGRRREARSALDRADRQVERGDG